MRHTGQNNWYVPLDGETSDTGLLGQHVADNSLVDGLGWRRLRELGAVVLVADVVSNTNKLTSVVGAGQKDDGDAQNLGGEELGDIGRVGLEDELVDSDGNRTDKERV
jgi:hypothetical protein